jgi:hypothetical protein
MGKSMGSLPAAVAPLRLSLSSFASAGTLVTRATRIVRYAARRLSRVGKTRIVIDQDPVWLL